MNKEKLEHYCDLQIEITNLEKRIERLKRQSPVVSDVVQNGHKKHAVIRGYDIFRSNRLEVLKFILENRQQELEIIKPEIENFIKKIPKLKIKRIFEYKYLNRF